MAISKKALGVGIAAGLGSLMIGNELRGGTEQSQRLRKCDVKL